MNPRIESRLLAATLRKVIIAGTSETKYHATGCIQLRFGGGSLTAVATDGHRLAVVKADVDTDGDTVEGLLPLDTANKLRLTLQKDKGTVEVCLPERWAQAGTKRVAWDKVEGKFPPWESVLPREEDFCTYLTADRDVLARCFRLAQIMATPYNFGTELSIDAGALTVASCSTDAGEYSETLDAVTKGEPLRLAMNASHVLDFLWAAAPGPIHLAIRDNRSAMEWRTLAEESGVHYRYILMPMRL